MLDETLAALALSGGATVTAAMATDAWLATRTGAARLFRRRGEGPEEEAGARLEDDNALVVRATSDDIERTRQALAATWQLRLHDLLREHPDAAEDLTELIAGIQAALPRPYEGPTQTNIARDNGQVFASLGGNVIVHQGPPGEAPRPAPAADRGAEDAL